MVERNMSSAVMRGTTALPGSKNTSRAKGLRWKLGDPTTDHWQAFALVRIGKARSCSRYARAREDGSSASKAAAVAQHAAQEASAEAFPG